MLHWKGNQGLEPWSTGAALLWITPEDQPWEMPVAVRCRLGGQKEILALLDTGAMWSVLDDGTAKVLGGHLEDLNIPVPMATRFGKYEGSLHRLDIELLADPGAGNDLAIEATVLVLPAWPGPVVLGVRGLLERVRLALDLGSVQPWFYFGPVV